MGKKLSNTAALEAEALSSAVAKATSLASRLRVLPSVVAVVGMTVHMDWWQLVVPLGSSASAVHHVLQIALFGSAVLFGMVFVVVHPQLEQLVQLAESVVAAVVPYPAR